VICHRVDKSDYIIHLLPSVLLLHCSILFLGAIFLNLYTTLAQIRVNASSFMHKDMAECSGLHPRTGISNVIQVTVKFGGHRLVINEVACETLGKELKSLVRTRLGSFLPENAQFQIKSQANGRYL